MEKQESPDGELIVEYAMHEMRMSHWVYQPRVAHVPSGEVLLDLWGPEAWAWDGHARFPEPGVVELVLRRYPAGGALWRLRIDARNGTWRYLEGETDEFLESRLSSQLRLDAT